MNEEVHDRGQEGSKAPNGLRNANIQSRIPARFKSDRDRKENPSAENSPNEVVLDKGEAELSILKEQNPILNIALRRHVEVDHTVDDST